MKLEELKEIFETHFPEGWEDYKIILSIPATLLLKDLSNPVGLIIEGAPSSQKTTYLSLLYDSHIVFHTDNFTPKSFVTHAANIKEEEKSKIDLLPKIRDKLFIVPELAPTFHKRKEDLVENLSTLTRVFDGEGYFSNTGLTSRGYKGEYLFAFIGATTPLTKQIWDTIGKLGNRWIALSIITEDKSEDDLLGVMQDTDYKIKIRKCKAATTEFMQELFKDGCYKIEWNKKEDNEQILRKIANLVQLVRKLRAPVQVWKEGDKSDEHYEFRTPVVEGEERLLTILYSFARGHAILHGRTKLNEEDWKATLRIGLSTMPYERVQLFRILLKHKGLLHKETLAKELNCSERQALRIMTQLAVLKVVDKTKETGDTLQEESVICLKPEFEWVLRENLPSISKADPRHENDTA